MDALLWTPETSTVQNVGAKRRKAPSNRKEKWMPEEGTGRYNLQLKRNQATKTTWWEKHHSEILQPVCACSDQLFYESVRQNTGMHGVKLLHYYAGAHKRKLMQQYLADENIETLPHPVYFPDLMPCDLFLLPDLKKCLAGQRFNSWSSLKSAIFQCLSHILKIEFKWAFLQWLKKTLKVCCSRWRAVWKVAVEESQLWWVEHFTSRISHKNKEPSCSAYISIKHREFLQLHMCKMAKWISYIFSHKTNLSVNVTW